MKEQDRLAIHGINYLILVAILMALFGCKQGHKTEQPQEITEAKTEIETEIESENYVREGIYALPGEYKLDYPKDLVAYFDSLCKEGARIVTHTDTREDSLCIWDAVRALDRFAQHKSKYFPATQIREALAIMRVELGYVFNHSGIEGPYGGEAFFFRLIEQAALHCNQIDYITDFRSDDRKAGVLYFNEWSPNPLYSLLVYQASQGFKVKMIGNVGDVKIEKIFHLTDEEGREYYLCSNNNDGPYFRQYLYGWEDCDLCLIREMDVEFGNSESYETDYELIFNPNKCSWSYCTKDGDIYHPVDGTPVLRLLLDGNASRFVVE